MPRACYRMHAYIRRPHTGLRKHTHVSDACGCRSLCANSPASQGPQEIKIAGKHTSKQHTVQHAWAGTQQARLWPRAHNQGCGRLRSAAACGLAIHHAHGAN